jgi:hypothetical protein
MFRKYLALLPIAAFTAAAFVSDTSDACISCWQLETGGTGKDDPNYHPPKVAPRTQCQSLKLYLADVPADPKAMSKYRFTGTCTFNVRPPNMTALMKTVEVLVDGEWHPGMSRASERVVVQDPEFAVSFSTWATCTRDPFANYGAACTNKGMGSNKFDQYISVDDVPYAANRVTLKSQVDSAVNMFQKAKARGAAANSFFQTPEVGSLGPIPKTASGTDSIVTLKISGGAGVCPMELDYGDGKKGPLPVWSTSSVDPFFMQLQHKYEKPGFYKVTARSLPGCSGEAIAYALVK